MSFKHMTLHVFDWYTRFIGILIAVILFVAFFCSAMVRKPDCLISLVLFVVVTYRVIDEWVHYLNRTGKTPTSTGSTL